MKVKLWNGGGYSFMGGANFPAVVEAKKLDDLPGVEVDWSEIKRIGATDPVWGRNGTVYFAENEFEVCDE